MCRYTVLHKANQDLHTRVQTALEQPFLKPMDTTRGA